MATHEDATMATMRWIGAALPVTQIDLITVANTWATNDTATVTIGGKSIVVTVGATATTAAVATAIKEAINGDTITGDATRSADGNDIPEFAEVTATVNGSVVTVTANTAGVPFTMTAAESTAGSGTAVRSASVACTGPNWWDNSANWDSGAVPTTGDTAYVDFSDVSILYGLGQSGVTLAALYIAQNFTGTIGLPEDNENGGYYEYRPQYLSIGATLLKVGEGGGTGSGRLKINTGSVQTALTVVNTGSPLEADLPALIWKGTHASNALTMNGGSVGVAVFGGDAATLATVDKLGGDLVTGRGTTLSGALVQNGGTWAINSLVDGSLTQSAGSTVISGTGNVDQLTIRGGTVSYLTSGTLGGATVISGDGVLDFGGASSAVTVVNRIDIHGTSAAVLDPFKRLGSVTVDFNEGAQTSQCVFGPNCSLTRGSVS